MAFGRTTRRGGLVYRLAEPGWGDPLDTSHSRAAGGRWNAPGRFGVLYLNATVECARLQVAHRLAGQPYGVEDLDEREQHDLVGVRVEEDDYLDCVSARGLAAVGLPPDYPRDVGWAVCQPIGAAARDDGRPGVACRSAATGARPDDEELAHFDGGAAPTIVDRRAFADWYWG